MGTKKSRKKQMQDMKLEIIDQIIEENISDYSERCFKRAAINTNIARAFPNALDGLKPSERRILYTIFKFHGPTKITKSSKIIGDTMGNFHPHGGGSIAGTIQKLSAPWKMLYPLIYIKGNGGNQMGDGAGADRYINIRMTKFAYDAYFSDWTRNIVDEKMNYLNEIPEPEYLPAKYPMVLINPSEGIGTGISTMIPAHNFEEVCTETIRLIKDKNYEPTLYPDSPTDAYVLKNKEAFYNIYEQGKGTFYYRGKADIVISDDDRECDYIHLTDLPFNVYSEALCESIKKIVNDKNNPFVGLKDIQDSSTMDGIDVKIIVKKGYNPYEILEKLYKRTRLEDFHTVQFEVVDNYKNVIMNLKGILVRWINFRRQTKRRFFYSELRTKRKRKHLLETLMYMLQGDNAERTLKIIRSHDNKKDILENLIKEYNVTDIQASAIMSMSLISFNKKGYETFKKEHDELDEEIKEIDKILRKKKYIDEIIIDELEKGIKKWAKPRNAELLDVSALKEYVDENDYYIVITKKGHIKKLPDVDHKVGKLKKDDSPIQAFTINNRDTLLLFSKKGKMYKLPVDKIHISDRETTGYLLSNYINIDSEIVSAMPKIEFDDADDTKAMKTFLDELQLTFITKNGIVKKMKYDTIMDCNSGIIAIKVKDGDELIDAKYHNGDRDLLIYTKDGYGLNMNTSNLQISARTSIGVKGIDLMDEDDCVAGLEFIDVDSDYFFICTANGNCKKVDLIDSAKRAGKGLRLTSVDKDDYLVKVLSVKANDSVIAYMKNKSVELAIKDVEEMTRITKGKKTISVPSGDMIIDISLNR